MAGEAGEVEPEASDVDGNVAPSDPADWGLLVQHDRPPSPHEASAPIVQPTAERRLSDRGGDCVARLQLRVAGQYTCTITLHGAEVNGSPFALEVTPGEVDGTQRPQ